MMQDEFIKMIDEYERQIKSPDGKGIKADRQIPMDTMIELDTLLSDRVVDPGDGFWSAAKRENPDYSHFEELPNLLKDYLAEKKLQEFAFETKGSFYTENTLVQEKLRKYSADPAFRRGICLGMERDDNPEQMMSCDSYMEQYENEKAGNKTTPQQELDSMIADYAKRIKNPSGKGIVADRRMRAETMMKLQDLLSDPEVNPGEAFKRATNPEKPDFSMYGDLPGLLKDYLAEMKLQEFAFKTNGSFDPSSPLVQRNLEKYSLDPTFRTGVNLRKHRPGSAEDMKACDSYMNMYIMEQTMKPVSMEQAERVNDVARRDANQILKRNEDKQVFLAKMMFLSQLGRFDQNEASGTRKPYESTITEAFSHGGRTGFILPPGKGQKKLFEALLGRNYYDKSGVKGRVAATHKVKQQTYHQDGTIARLFEEKTSKGSFKKQYGMNLALGGIGQIGPNQKPIMDQGMDGHMYMNIQKGGDRRSGSLLIGIENEGPGKTGRLGYAHTAAAVKSDQSAFMSDKQGLGKEIGGRTIDLSHIDPDTLSKMISDFEKGYRSMMQSAKSNMNSMKELLDVNRSLCGKYMNPEDMANLMTHVGIQRKDAVAAVNHARSYSQGHYNDKIHENAYVPVDESHVRKERERKAVSIPQKPKFLNRLGAFFGMKRQVELCKAYDEYKNSGVISGIRDLNDMEKQDLGSKRLNNMKGKANQERLQAKVDERSDDKVIRITKENLDIQKESRPRIPKAAQWERGKAIYQKSPYLREPGKMMR